MPERLSSPDDKSFVAPDETQRAQTLEEYAEELRGLPIEQLRTKVAARAKQIEDLETYGRGASEGSHARFEVMVRVLQERESQK